MIYFVVDLFITKYIWFKYNQNLVLFISMQLGFRI